jgi:hypothetical protein
MTMDAMSLKALGATLILAALLPGIAAAETPVPTDLAQEEAFLSVLPKIDVPDDVQPIPGAVNEEFRNCEAQWPIAYKDAQSGSEARALRDIYSFVRARNVIATGDCGCTGKVANWDDVEAVAAALREAQKVDRLTWQHTATISSKARRLIAVAETMCSGSF